MALKIQHVPVSGDPNQGIDALKRQSAGVAYSDCVRVDLPAGTPDRNRLTSQQIANAMPLTCVSKVSATNSSNPPSRFTMSSGRPAPMVRHCYPMPRRSANRARYAT